jgi:Ala-tRNA(Pro) deacylase
VPPIGECYGLDVIMDDSIQEQPEVYQGIRRSRETLVHMSQTQFARVMAQAQHGRFSVHD